MENKENKIVKKNKIIKVTALLGLFLLVFGVSYALFSVVLEGTKKNTIKTGKLELKLLNEQGNTIEGETIGLENVIPVINEEGLTTTPYTFTIENSGSLEAEYKITLDDLDLESGEERLEDKYIKTHLVITDEAGKTIESTPIILSAIENRILDAGVILPGKSRSYKLYMWLDLGADENAINKVFSAKLKLEGTQVNKTTDERTILRRINADGTNDSTRVDKTGKIKVYTSGYTSATIYKDGKVRFIGDGSTSSQLDFQLYDEEKYVSYHKELLTAAGFDVESLTTKEEIDNFLNNNDYDNGNFWTNYDELWKSILEEAGIDTSDWTDTITGEINKAAQTNNIELYHKLSKVYIDKTGVLVGNDRFDEEILNYFIKDVYVSKTVRGAYLSNLKYIEKLTLENGIEITPSINSYLLTNLTIPNTVTLINYITAPNMKEITIPNSVTNVVNGAFSSWTSDQTINVDNTKEATSGWWSGWSGEATVNYLR
ncbi:MAG: hypothetical protein ACI4OT_03325 [Bacilli bacterium]